MKLGYMWQHGWTLKTLYKHKKMNIVWSHLNEITLHKFVERKRFHQVQKGGESSGNGQQQWAVQHFENT